MFIVKTTKRQRQINDLLKFFTSLREPKKKTAFPFVIFNDGRIKIFGKYYEYKALKLVLYRTCERESIQKYLYNSSLFYQLEDCSTSFSKKIDNIITKIKSRDWTAAENAKELEKLLFEINSTVIQNLPGTNVSDFIDEDDFSKYIIKSLNKFRERLFEIEKKKSGYSEFQTIRFDIDDEEMLESANRHLNFVEKLFFILSFVLLNLPNS